jgi:hypothetical protein
MKIELKKGKRGEVKAITEINIVGINPNRKNEHIVVMAKKEASKKGITPTYSVELHTTPEFGKREKWVDMDWAGNPTEAWNEDQLALIDLYGAQVVKSGVVLYFFTTTKLNVVMNAKRNLITLAQSLSKLV